MYEYEGSLVRVIDGDTVVLILDMGFDTSITKTCRLHGIDTPESRTRDPVEKEYGIAATTRLKELLSDEPTVMVRSVDKGKFGRPLVILYKAGFTRSINDILVDEHLAVKYHGQSKDDVEAAHVANRFLLGDRRAVMVNG